MVVLDKQTYSCLEMFFNFLFSTWFVEVWRSHMTWFRSRKVCWEALFVVKYRDMEKTVLKDGEGNGTPLQYSCLENPMDRGAWWAAVHGVTKNQTWLSDFPFTFHFHASEKEMATHSSVLAWRIPGTGEPGGLPSMGLHRVGHDWSDLAAAAAAVLKEGEMPGGPLSLDSLQSPARLSSPRVNPAHCLLPRLCFLTFDLEINPAFLPPRPSSF